VLSVHLSQLVHAFLGAVRDGDASCRRTGECGRVGREARISSTVRPFSFPSSLSSEVILAVHGTQMSHASKGTRRPLSRFKGPISHNQDQVHEAPEAFPRSSQAAPFTACAASARSARRVTPLVRCSWVFPAALPSHPVAAICSGRCQGGLYALSSFVRTSTMLGVGERCRIESVSTSRRLANIRS
jgi:hypothetical protein